MSLSFIIVTCTNTLEPIMYEQRQRGKEIPEVVKALDTVCFLEILCILLRESIIVGVRREG